MSNKQQSAFPHPKDGGAWGNDPVPGLSIRDYFAAKAMQGVLSSPNYGVYGEDALAALAYKIADAMLREREKK
jgi:hypothetical protein